MATIPYRFPPVRSEYIPTSPPPPSLQPNLTKQEPLQLTNTNNTPPPPHFINSVNELRSLSTALSNFHRCYDELQSHLDFIKSSIDSKLPDQILISLPETVKTPPPELTVIPEQNPNPNDTINSEQKPENPNPNPNPTLSELEFLCETMCSRSVRKYLITHISNLNKLREEVPKALKFAKEPGKLVLDCIGRFFLQGRKAYTKDSKMIPGREASVMALECFLLMGNDGVEIASEVEEEAVKAAVAWRKRLLSEGGLAKADETDARGLLFLISGFGIPGVFKNEDIRDLIRASKVKGISAALRRSIVLIPRIPEIIEWMVKNKLEIEAADMAYTFGLEDRCSPRTILTTFLSKNIKDRTQGSSTGMNEANKQLADLKSIRNCLEAHKIDPSKLLPEWKINEKILSLEKEITELDMNAREMAMQKRKAGETESSNKLKSQEVKRPRFTGHNLSHEQKAADIGYLKSSYNGLAQTSSYLDGRVLPEDYMNIYSASSSVLHGTRLPESAIGSTLRGSAADLSGGGVPTSSYGGAYGAIGSRLGGSGAELSAGGVPTSSYGGAYGGTVVDAVGGMVYQSNGQPYGWRGDPALNERLNSQTFSGQTYAPQPSSSGLMGLYRSSVSSLEGFAGLPNQPNSVGVSARSSGSDLYQFADSVLERESYRTSGSHAGGGAMHPILPSHHSSHLY